jgi:phosphatidylserine/phosphatidylglycerophosphate/cardiolipin synthase-like enzyme
MDRKIKTKTVSHMATRLLITIHLSLVFSIAQAQVSTWKKITEEKIIAGGEFSFCGPPLEKVSPGQQSRLMKSIMKDVDPFIKKGSVSKKMMITNKNFVSRRVFRTGNEIFNLTRELIKNSQKEVLLQTYLYEKGSQGVLQINKGIMELQARLKKKGKPKVPVNVKLLIDDQSGIVGLYLKWAGEILSLDHKDPTGKDVYGLGFQQPIDPDYVRLEVKLYRHSMTGTNHSKTMVIDRAFGIVTGANYRIYHDRTPEFKNIAEFTDHGYLVMGDVADGMAKEFYVAWEDGTKYKTNSKQSATGWNDFSQKVPFKLPKSVEKWVSGKILAKNVPVAIITRRPNNNPLKRNHKNPLGQTFFSILRRAERHVDIINPNMGNPAIVNEVISAMARGIDINILLSKDYQDDLGSIPGAGGTNSKNVKTILNKRKKLMKKKGKRKIGHFNLRWFIDRRGRLSQNRTYTSHTKYIAADNQIVMVGSANLDSMSLFYAREINILVDSPDIANIWCRQVFRTDFLRGQNYKKGD